MPSDKFMERVSRWAYVCRQVVMMTGLLPLSVAWGKTPASLDEVLLQIDQLRHSYESRISTLEKQVRQGQQQKAEDARRIEKLEKQLAESQRKPPDPGSEHRQQDRPEPLAKLHHAPLAPTAETPPPLKEAPPPGGPVGSGSSDKEESQPRTVAYSPPMAAEGPILMAPSTKGSHLKRQGAVLLDEPDAALPFSMQANMALEGRYSYFGRTKAYWIPNNQPQQPVRDYSIIELNRFLFMLSGYAFDPKLKYAFMMFGSSAAGAYMPLGYAGYDWMPELKGRIGVWKTPGTREWTDSYNATLGSDRTMATTYFRPNWTPGAWIEGVLDKTFQYELMIGNSFGGSAQNTTSNRIGTGMLYSANAKWEPCGGDGFWRFGSELA